MHHELLAVLRRQELTSHHHFPGLNNALAWNDGCRRRSGQGAKYCQEYFPDFTTVEKLVFTILNSKEGASNHMELLCKSCQISNVVISKAPCQNGGENSHATDPGKPEGSHFILTKNHDSLPTGSRQRKPCD
jgi:hypothetical protein